MSRKFSIIKALLRVVLNNGLVVVPLASGGFRGAAGRPLDPNSLNAAKGKHDDAWTVLEPASGEIPDWPLHGISERERVWWDRLWQLPQASKWAELMVVDSVALYVRYLVEAELPGAQSNTRTLVKQYQEMLGLSTTGLRAQRWQLPAGEVPKVEAGPKRKASSRARLKVVNGDGG